MENSGPSNTWPTSFSVAKQRRGPVTCCSGEQGQFSPCGGAFLCVLAQRDQPPPSWQSTLGGKTFAATFTWQNWDVAVAGRDHDSLTDVMLSDVSPAKKTSCYGKQLKGINSHFSELLIWFSQETSWLWIHKDCISQRCDFSSVSYRQVTPALAARTPWGAAAPPGPPTRS